jgi:cytochrome c oxidase subunit 2
MRALGNPPRPLFLVLVLMTFTVVVAGIAVVDATQTGAPPDRRVVRVRAERFSFTPSQITLVAGETIEIRVKSDDTTHGFHIKGTDTDIAVPKRGQGETSILFTGNDPGRYEFECTRMCGAGHDFMRGVIVVNPARAATP